MENATKALIISAAVLIVIVLIAVGIKILGSTSETTEAAEKTGNEIVDAIGQASGGLKDKMEDSNYERLDNDSFMEKVKVDYAGQQSGKKVKKLLNLIKSRYGSLNSIAVGENNKDRLYITSDAVAYENEFTYLNIEAQVKTNEEYTVIFDVRASINCYSIMVIPN